MVKDTLRMWARKAKNKWYSYDEAEVRVREATSNDAWGASSSLLRMIAEDCDHPVRYQSVMSMLMKRLTDEKHFRHVLKSLNLVDFLLRNGNKKFVHDMHRRKKLLQSLKGFKYWNDNGEDIGGEVRSKASAVLELMDDDEALSQARSKARSTRGKIYGIDRNSRVDSYKSSNRRRLEEDKSYLDDYFSEDSGRKGSVSESDDYSEEYETKRSKKSKKVADEEFDGAFDKPDFAASDFVEETKADSPEPAVTRTSKRKSKAPIINAAEFDDILGVNEDVLDDEQREERERAKADDFLDAYLGKTKQSSGSDVDIVTGSSNPILNFDFFAPERLMIEQKPAEKDDFVALFDEVPKRKSTVKESRSQQAESPEDVWDFEKQVLSINHINAQNIDPKKLPKRLNKNGKSLKEMAHVNGKQLEKRVRPSDNNHFMNGSQLVVYTGVPSRNRNSYLDWN